MLRELLAQFTAWFLGSDYEAHHRGTGRAPENDHPADYKPRHAADDTPTQTQPPIARYGSATTLLPDWTPQP